MNTFNTFAPMFPGFYNTALEYDNEEQGTKSYNEENKTEYEYDDFAWDYKGYHIRVAKAFVNRLESELKQFLEIQLEFQELISPKEYNFTTDSINIAAELDLNELLKLIVNRFEQAKDYFAAHYTSCSGFVSSHSNNIADWLNKDYILAKPEHRIGALLNCLCDIELDQDSITYWCDSENHISYSVIEQ